MPNWLVCLCFIKRGTNLCTSSSKDKARLVYIKVSRFVYSEILISVDLPVEKQGQRWYAPKLFESSLCSQILLSIYLPVNTEPKLVHTEVGKL